MPPINTLNAADAQAQAEADADTHADGGPAEALPLPCPHALIAGTLALMTTWADPAPGSALDVASLRSLIARKVVSNLFFLAGHPALPPAMRQVMGQARERWLAVTSAAAPGLPACAPAFAAPMPAGTRWH